MSNFTVTGTNPDDPPEYEEDWEEEEEDWEEESYYPSLD